MIAYNKSYTKLRGNVSACVAFLFMVIVAVVSFSSMTLILPFEKITKSQKVEINDNAGNHTKLTVIATSVSQVLVPVVYSSYLLGFLGNMALTFQIQQIQWNLF